MLQSLALPVVEGTLRHALLVRQTVRRFARIFLAHRSPNATPSQLDLYVAVGGGSWWWGWVVDRREWWWCGGMGGLVGGGMEGTRNTICPATAATIIRM